MADKAHRSSNWARLIARIYEANPLICTRCGKSIRIISFITHREAIWRILRGIGLGAVVPEFDPVYDITDRDICQLVPGTKDGFPEMDEQFHCDIGPDPPHEGDYCDPHRLLCLSAMVLACCLPIHLLLAKVTILKLQVEIRFRRSSHHLSAQLKYSQICSEDLEVHKKDFL